MGLIIRWLLNTLALFIVAYVVPHVSYTSFLSLFIAAAVLGLLNALVRPILFVLTLPITVVTLGLFVIVLNAVMLKLTDWIVPGFEIEGFGWAMLAAILLSVVSFFTNKIGRSERDER